MYYYWLFNINYNKLFNVNKFSLILVNRMHFAFKKLIETCKNFILFYWQKNFVVSYLNFLLWQKITNILYYILLYIYYNISAFLMQSRYGSLVALCGTIKMLFGNMVNFCSFFTILRFWTFNLSLYLFKRFFVFQFLLFIFWFMFSFKVSVIAVEWCLYIMLSHPKKVSYAILNFYCK